MQFNCHASELKKLQNVIYKWIENTDLLFTIGYSEPSPILLEFSGGAECIDITIEAELYGEFKTQIKGKYCSLFEEKMMFEDFNKLVKQSPEQYLKIFVHDRKIKVYQLENK